MLSFAQAFAGMLLLFFVSYEEELLTTGLQLFFESHIYSLLIILLGVCDVVSIMQVSFVFSDVVDWIHTHIRVHAHSHTLPSLLSC